MNVATSNQYFYGWEVLSELAIEKQGFWGIPCPSANFNGFAHLKSVAIDINENLQRDSSLDGGTGRAAQAASKGNHELNCDINFWLPDDIDATAFDAWFIKLGLDAFNVAHSGTAWVVPNTGTSAYPSNELHSFNLEVGHNKTGNLRIHHLLGLMANQMSIKASRSKEVEFTLNCLGKRAYMNQTSFTNGSATQSAGIPYKWEHCQIEFGDDNDTGIKTDFMELNINFNHNLLREYDIGESSILVDALDATTGWVDSTDATLATSTTAFHEGAGSLSLAKDGTSSTACSTQKTIDALDASNKIMYLWVYIADSTTLTAIDVGAAANNHIKLGTGGVTNYNQYNMGTGLAVGWNLIRMDIDAPDTTGGSGADETLIDTVAIVFKSDATGDTWAANKLLIDHLRIFTPRSPSAMIPGTFMGSGTFKVNLTTASGMTLYRDLADDTGDPIEMQDTSNSKEILFRIRNLAAPTTQKMEWRLRDVQLGQIPKELNPEAVTEVEVPFTFQYYLWTFTTPDTSAPTNFDDQS